MGLQGHQREGKNIFNTLLFAIAIVLYKLYILCTSASPSGKALSVEQTKREHCATCQEERNGGKLSTVPLSHR